MDRRTHTALLLAVAVISACDATAPDPPEVRSVDVLPAVAPVHRLRVELNAVAPLVVEYGSAGEAALRTESAPAVIHEITLARLRPDGDYVYDITGTGVTGSFHAPSLPADLRSIEFTASGAPTVPLVLLHLFSPEGFRGYVVVDGTGKVMWWWRTEDFPFGAARRDNGNFVFMDRGAGLLEVTPAGDVVHVVVQDTVTRELHHDAITTARQTVLFIAHDPRPVAGEKVRGEAIWEWTPETGALQKRWSSWDHLSIETDRGPRFGSEWMHANALAEGPTGNVLLSVHYFNQVISLSPDFASIEWRLGGPNATITAVGEPFSGQHTARLLDANTLLLFDNGLDRGGPSRAVEYTIDGDRAVERWTWQSPAGNFASAVSSARRLENGNTMVAFGMSAGANGSTGPLEVFEVDPVGAVVWHLRVEGTRIMFRAEPLQTIAGER